MNRLGIDKFPYYVSFILILSVFIPIIPANLPPYLRSHHLLTLLWFTSLVLFYPQIFLNKQMLVLILYFIFIYVFFLSEYFGKIGNWNRIQLIDEWYQIFTAVSVITFYRTKKMYIELANLSKWFLVVTFFTIIMTFVTHFIDPFYARNFIGLADYHGAELDNLYSIRRLGSANYGIATALVCLIPILAYYFKNGIYEKFTKPYIMFYVIIIPYTLVKMQIFANVLIATVVLLISLSMYQKRTVLLFITAFLVILIFSIPTTIYSDLFYKISTLLPENSDISFKFKDLSMAVGGSDYFDNRTAIGGRANRYPMLIDSFIKSPLLGGYLSGNNTRIDVGAHLHWMFKIGAYGLLGTLPFIYIFYNFVKNSLFYMDNKYKFYYVLSVISFISLGLLKALNGREMWYMLIVVVPGLYYLPLLSKKK